MSYVETAHSAAEAIFEAATGLRTPGAFGAVDALLCLVAGHPATPEAICQLLVEDPDETVKLVAQS